MQGNTTFIALVVIIAIAAAAYFLLTGSSSQTDLMGVTGESAMQVENALPPATDSVDDFAAAMEAELSASAAAIKAFDADIDASVADVRAAADTTTLYDPDNL